ncbi:DUF3800 domain-containing protein [uncultured Parvimonas sp.]|uniref:DUF3800 domain-containing protein n=1 Tax=uncultured Parvimonas sp. TaxID=747372 RepID=UPI0028D5F5EC|nr:DUF3800 domain-containing protein [uncultured Parvimonas sp.]
MVKIDVSDIKNMFRNLNNIPLFDEKMTFYYDESGNCRKFLLTENGFNNSDALRGDFVLAGVAHDGESFDININELYNIFEYKEGQKELKFKHLFFNSKDFISFMGSKRATNFLDWLEKSGLYVHYSALNNLFYSIVDIVDSLWETHPWCIMYSWEIKSALYDFVIEHQDEVIDLFIRHTYPDVKKVSNFCSELSSFIQDNNDDSDHSSMFYLELFRQMLKTAGKHNKMIFIQDNEPRVLIEEYYMLYLERCQILSKSNHIFDEEVEVQKKLKDIQLYEDGKLLNNFRFIKSHENIFIQLSDMIAGLLRKLFMFLDEKSIDEISSITLQLKDKEKNNFLILRKLIFKSLEKSLIFIKNANTYKNIDERALKLEILGVKNKVTKEEGMCYEL